MRKKVSTIMALMFCASVIFAGCDVKVGPSEKRDGDNKTVEQNLEVTGAIDGAEDTGDFSEGFVSIEETENEEVKSEEPSKASLEAEWKMGSVIKGSYTESYPESGDVKAVLDVKRLGLFPDYGEYYVNDAINSSDLAEGLENLMKKYDDTAESDYSGIKEVFESDEADAVPVPEWLPFYAKSDCGITRSDNRVTSVVQVETINTGGAHPSSYVSAYSLDSATGKELLLDDVFTDASKVPDLILKYIDPEVNLYAEKDYFKLQQEAEGLRFTVDNYGVTFYFSPIEIAPHSDGIVTVAIPFNENMDILDKKYCSSSVEYGAYPVCGVTYRDYFFSEDVLGSLDIYNNEDENGNVISITICVDGQSDEQQIGKAETVSYAYIAGADTASVLLASVEGTEGVKTIYSWQISSEGLKYAGKIEGLSFPACESNLDKGSDYILLPLPENMRLQNADGVVGNYNINEKGLPEITDM